MLAAKLPWCMALCAVYPARRGGARTGVTVGSGGTGTGGVVGSRGSGAGGGSVADALPRRSGRSPIGSTKKKPSTAAPTNDSPGAHLRLLRPCPDQGDTPPSDYLIPTSCSRLPHVVSAHKKKPWDFQGFGAGEGT